MKKLFALMLALLMVFTLTAFADTADLTGDWYLFQIVVGEEAVDSIDYQFNMLITLNADGTAKLHSENFGDVEEDDEATWTMDGETLVVTDSSGAAQNIEVKDGCLYINMYDDEGILEGTTILGREYHWYEKYAAGEAVAITSLDALNGNWDMNLMEMFNSQLKPEEVAGSGFVDLDLWHVTIEGGILSAKGINGLNEETSLEGLALELCEDGSAKLTVPAPSEYFTDDVYAITLHADGVMMFTAVDDLFGTILYFQPAAQ